MLAKLHGDAHPLKVVVESLNRVIDGMAVAQAVKGEMHMEQSARRVVVTGMGVIHALGTDADSFWNAVVSGASGISLITREEFARFPTRIASVVENFPEDTVPGSQGVEELGPLCAFWRVGVPAGVGEGRTPRRRDSGASGSASGWARGSAAWRRCCAPRTPWRRGDGWRTSPFTIPMMIANMGAALVSMTLGARGPCLTPVTACATGNNSIGEAFLAVRDGRIDVAVAGGAEAIHPAPRLLRVQQHAGHVHAQRESRARPAPRLPRAGTVSSWEKAPAP